jgi:tRNA pseudouridine55 synthase
MAGVLVLDKPLGMTSMSAVASVRLKCAGGDRKRARKIKVGHAGTLDPLATGVLVIAVGSMTKMIDTLMRGSKRYFTDIDLSAFTTTDDCEGERTEIAVTAQPSEAELRDALSRLEGLIMQRPPAFSAKKINGQRAYKLARQGLAPELKSHEVLVHSIELLEYRWPLAQLSIHCEKGFYVRSLARELGQALGTGGHCAMIRRTAVGPFTLAMAHQLEALPSPLTEAGLMNSDSVKALLDSPAPVS